MIPALGSTQSAGGVACSTMASRESEHLRLVYETVISVLREEQRAWEALAKESVARFRSFASVRAAPETTIGYLAVRRLLASDSMPGQILKTEHGYSKTDYRMDFWIGADETKPGLGIELKLVLARKVLRGAAVQADRLVADANLAHRGFILWGFTEMEDGDKTAVRFGEPWFVADQRSLGLHVEGPPGLEDCRVVLLEARSSH